MAIKNSISYSEIQLDLNTFHKINESEVKKKPVIVRFSLND